MSAITWTLTVTSAILTGSLLTKATGRQRIDFSLCRVTRRSVPQTWKQGGGPKLALEPQLRADCDENKPRLVRAPGESYSNVILRLGERRQALEKLLAALPGLVRRPFRAECPETNDAPPAALSGGVEMDSEGFIRPSYTRRAEPPRGASREMSPLGHQRDTLLLALVSQAIEIT